MLGYFGAPNRMYRLEGPGKVMPKVVRACYCIVTMEPLEGAADSRSRKVSPQRPRRSSLEDDRWSEMDKQASAQGGVTWAFRGPQGSRGQESECSLFRHGGSVVMVRAKVRSVLLHRVLLLWFGLRVVVLDPKGGALGRL